MFDKMKLSTMLAFGFGMIVALFIATSTLSYYAISDSTKGFSEYRNLARDTNLAGRLQANMLFVRLFVKEFFKTGDQSSVNNYRSRLKKLQSFLDEARTQIQEPSRARQVALISESIDDYVQNFDIIIDMKTKRDDLVFNNLDPTGIIMRTKLSSLIESAYADNAPDIAYYAGRIQERVLLARLYANKFLNTNSNQAALRFKKEIGIEIDTLATTLSPQLTDTNRRLFFATFQTSRAAYIEHFDAIEKLILERNAIINNQLDRIGPIISLAAEDVKLSVKSDQDKLGPKVQQDNEYSTLVISVISIIGLSGSMLVAWLITVQIKKPIGGEPLEIMGVTTEVARGNTDINFPQEASLSGIFLMLKTMVDALNNKVNIAQEIARGNLDVKVELSSSKDTLGIALQQMVVQLRERDNKITEETQAKALILSDLERQDWLKTQIAAVNNVSQGVINHSELCQRVITIISKSLQAAQGVIYIVKKEDSKLLKLYGSYAFNKRKSNDNTIEFGQGLAGQSAIEKESIVLVNVPQEHTTITSALGKSAPLNIIATPILFQDATIGVIEVASFNHITEIQQDFMEQVADNLGVIINSVSSRKQVEQLLKNSKQQAEVLTFKQQELEQANEVLQSKTELLTISEENLKQQSEELRASNDELSDKQRSLHQQKKKIEQSQRELTTKAEELAQASKYKSEFLANMSHELRTPLNSLLLLAKGLSENKKNNLDKIEVEDAQIIYRGGQNLLLLINDILDLSKVEAGKLTLHITAVEVNSIVENLKQLFAPMAKEKSIEFDVDVDSQVPTVIETDSLRIEQILRNLLSNAIKFTEVGHVRLAIKLIKTPAGGAQGSLSATDSVIFSVIDSGIGIPQNKIESIFEAFQQQDGSTSRKYGGTGLGLTIAKELTHLLGANISIQSEVNKGSTFTLAIPLNELPMKQTEIESALTIETNTSKESVDSATDKPQPQQAFPAIRTDLPKLPDESKVLISTTDQDFKDKVQQFDKNVLIVDSLLDACVVAVNSTIEVFVIDHPLTDDQIQQLVMFVRTLAEAPVKVYFTIPERDNNCVDSILPYIDEEQGDINLLNKHNDSELDILFQNVGDQKLVLATKNTHSHLLLEHIKILLIDTDMRFAYSLSKQLLSVGAHVDMSNTEQYAIELLATEGYDLIIIDPALNEQATDCVNTITAIRDLADYAEKPLMVLTDQHNEAAQQRFLTHGANIFVSKPIHFDILIPLIYLNLYSIGTSVNEKADD
ncbi:ATP-binding protein [Psychrobium sp. 1_MG-2023]|uniref:ATP-binding protein n=1 Tax=Psychrobium sp. 1_MG-2023 TaxID=3062624 RepID=UPI0026BC6B76|nr:ATP-binding protein [Psychrobium sp. 1_MG-2023]MDP2560331.1 ATP-binding protein [Psychrobium sp. 1_MG-2023]